MPSMWTLTPSDGSDGSDGSDVRLRSRINNARQVHSVNGQLAVM